MTRNCNGLGRKSIKHPYQIPAYHQPLSCDFFALSFFIGEKQLQFHQHKVILFGTATPPTAAGAVDA